MPDTLLEQKKTRISLRPPKEFIVREIVPDKISDYFKALKAVGLAMDGKAAAVGSSVGSPVGPVEFGGGNTDGYYRRYQNGVIYQKPPAGPCWVHGAILQKYVELGAEAGFLGYPTTDETGTPGGAGRYNHFERGSIYWTYRTGAHEVHGAIRDKWAALGWEQSWLGFPTSDELPFVDGGRVSTFEHGSIYWWPDTGAIELGNVALRYKGLYCFGETDEASASDEPYVTFGVGWVPAYQNAEVTRALRSQIYDNVDAGDSRPDTLDLYTGMPGGVAVGLSLIEHDEGNPDEYLRQIKDGVALAGKGISAGCGALFGPEAAPVCDKLWTEVSPYIVTFVNDILGSGDDLIDKWSFSISAKDMVLRARAPRANFWGIEYHFESALLSDGEASYKVYFDIVPV